DAILESFRVPGGFAGKARDAAGGLRGKPISLAVFSVKGRSFQPSVHRQGIRDVQGNGAGADPAPAPSGQADEICGGGGGHGGVSPNFFLDSFLVTKLNTA